MKPVVARKSPKADKALRAKRRGAVQKKAAAPKGTRMRKTSKKVSRKGSKKASEQEYEVERVSDMKYDAAAQDLTFLVVWKGYPEDPDNPENWLHLEDLVGCQEALYYFMRQQGQEQAAQSGRAGGGEMAVANSGPAPPAAEANGEQGGDGGRSSFPLPATSVRGTRSSSRVAAATRVSPTPGV